MKLLFSFLLSFAFALTLPAQIYNPVSWETEVQPLKKGSYQLIIHAKIEKGWHLYSQNLPSNDGPIATEFTFVKTNNFSLKGTVQEPTPKIEFDTNFDMELSYFEKEVTFSQTIVTNAINSFTIKGEVYFMVCNDVRCLPPEYVDLEFTIPGNEEIGDNRLVAKEKITQEEKSSSETKADEVNIISLNEESTSNESSDFQDPIKWTFSSKKIESNVYELLFEAKLDEGWHIYAQELQSDDGPIATSFIFNEAEGSSLVGEVIERGERITAFDPNFEMDLNYFSNQVIFVQKVNSINELITGEFEFMVCNEVMCLPPEIIEFQIDLSTGKGYNLLDITESSEDTDISTIVPELPNVNLDSPIGDCGEKTEVRNLWLVFIFGFLGGLIALLTPCVFPMIPLTVSFFTKGDGEGKGFGKALLYGFFIFLIYAILSIPFHFNTDPEVLNEIATSVWLNVLFFVIFVVFAISFFGYFEITLPSSFTNKADSASQVGGVIGIFFMALTLALVSFSCTGPILGTVLGSALKNGPWPITIAMSGFGIALGLPFAVFAAFPGMMSKLPKSGGWLNSVKVVLGFIELALAVKFLSNADLVEQWGLLKRETFFLIWTLIGIGLVAYLFGWIKFPHDSPVKKLSKFRLGFATLILIFTIYIAPGILKNPPWNHNLLSGFPPPTFYGWYEKETFHAEFMDFDEAMKEAKIQNKPLLIDFTGWACVNCRKMEESVWTVPAIKKRLSEEFVLVSLYVDDKVLLPESQQGVFEFKRGGEIQKKKIKTIGNKWATFQTQVFNNNSQPFYVMLSPEGYLLGNPQGYTPDVEDYAAFLDCGLKAFEDNK
tara:strand:+ start:1131 stop:3620 length:2490 start_codon:yes stop_codon:yes gene_type:complete